jgi:hypothetical protein
MMHEEQDWEKHARLKALKMSNEEWDRLKLFVELLEVSLYIYYRVTRY